MRKTLPLLALTPLLMVSCSCSPTDRPGQAQTTDAASSAASRTSLTGADATLNSVNGSIAPISAVAGPDQVLRLTLLDETSHQPVEHAGLNLLGANSLQWTDKNGQHDWSGGIGVSSAIEIRCPAMRAETGRKIKTVPYKLSGKLTEISATIDSSVCIEPPEKSTTGTYAGTFFKYYEHGAFVPCNGLPADASFYGNNKSAWIDFTGSTADDFQKMLPTDPHAMDNGIYAEFNGNLTGPGAYGTQGYSAYKLDVTEVKKVSTESPEDCPLGKLE